MLRPIAALVAAMLFVTARADSQVDGAIRALRKDSSLKVRTQAAMVLGQRRAKSAVPALREAVAADESAAVRLAAIAALARINDRSATGTLRASAETDPDSAVRKAAMKALEELGPLEFSIEAAAGAGDSAARAALRDAIGRELLQRGFLLVDRGGIRIKPSILGLDVDTNDGKTVIAVKVSLVAVEDDGRMAAMLEGGARLTASGTIPEKKLGVYSGKALQSAAKAVCEDLAAKLGPR